MNIKNLEGIKGYYDSDKYDDPSYILENFYIPLLENSEFYLRLTGPFSSTILAATAKGISKFIKNNGKMELICWEELKKEDVDAILQGHKNAEEILQNELLDKLCIEDLEDEITQDHLKVLSWMVAKGILDIKIAIRPETKGIFHLKSGFFRDNEGNEIIFSGSENESIYGWKFNHEKFHVFKNWESNDELRYLEELNTMETVRKGEGKNTRIFNLPDAVKQKLIRYSESITKNQILDLKLEKRLLEEIKLEFSLKKAVKKKKDILHIPEYIDIRDYQNEAIDKWFDNSKRGILKMATGTGKTITALALASKLYNENNNKLAIIVACPYKHLVRQWESVAKEFNLDPILGYESTSSWVRKLNRKITSFNMGTIDHFCLITTHTTFGLDAMRNSIGKLTRNDDVLLIVDEVHHFGAMHLSTTLPNNIEPRLGLSATPEDWYDESRTDILTEYFGKIIYEYGLDLAIKNNWLTRYHYFPHIVELTEEEAEMYYDISNSIARLVGQMKNKKDFLLSDDQRLQLLLIQRANIIGAAVNKISKLKELLTKDDEIKHTLVYVGVGNVADDFDEQLYWRYRDRIIRMMGVELGLKVHPFTAEESQQERKELLSNFEKERLQALVAIRCLDEGVDVPATKTAYILASSTNPRQFIQRRGRILRKHKGKKFSYIHDFIIVPPQDVDLPAEIFNIERGILERELKRVKWFTELAENGAWADSQLLPLKEKYNLLHI